MLSDRRQRVLAALIEEYVHHALPVGSRTLVENYHLGVSSATVRNELSVLEEAGYITQPHTSAGRIPTDFGYRSFVDDLFASELGEGEDADDQARNAVEQARSAASEVDDLLQQTTAALARLTECLSIVVPPSSLSLQVRQVSFVSMTPYRVLLVVVTENGQVLNRTCDFAEEVSPDDLGMAQQAVNNLIVGKSLADMRAEIDGGLNQQLQNPLVKIMLGEVLSCLQGREAGHAHRLGLSTLLQQPEFQHAKALVPVLQSLEDDTVLFELLDSVQGEGKTVVRIGHENENELLSGVSVVASQFGNGSATGVVAVIGPTRMNYAQVIRAVRAARETLDSDNPQTTSTQEG
ncbi:MAG: heat-inducible transcription repressor HrcA [Eggerthellaceae bacterium]|nr:heat-inducible transcription repressor HrcA [Eggerthellaceae bacterium]